MHNRDVMSANAYPTRKDRGVTTPTERGTGFSLAACSLILGAVPLRDVPAGLAASIGIACVLTALAVGAPRLLRPLHRFWIRFLSDVNKVLNPLVMAVIVMLAIVPVGVFMQHARCTGRWRRMAKRSAGHPMAHSS